MEQKTVCVGNVRFSNNLPFALICGPCQIESRDHAVMIAGAMREITSKLHIPYVFKASFDKANRTSINGARGVGLEEGIQTFETIKKLYPDLPIVTDVHETWQCEKIAPFVDMLQIPAFLCRQTDLVVTAAQTGKAINIKKGQFLAPWDVKNLVQKSVDSGNNNVLLTERGTSFGYNTLIVDMRSFPEMAEQTGCPVIIDATHSVQQPGGNGTSTGGRREFAPVLARAALAVGVAGVFIETHDNPDKALSDGPNSIALADMENLLIDLKAYDEVRKKSVFKLSF